MEANRFAKASSCLSSYVSASTKSKSLREQARSALKYSPSGSIQSMSDLKDYVDLKSDELKLHPHFSKYDSRIFHIS